MWKIDAFKKKKKSILHNLLVRDAKRPFFLLLFEAWDVLNGTLRRLKGLFLFSFFLFYLQWMRVATWSWPNSQCAIGAAGGGAWQEGQCCRWCYQGDGFRQFLPIVPPPPSFTLSGNAFSSSHLRPPPDPCSFRPYLHPVRAVYRRATSLNYT